MRKRATVHEHCREIMAKKDPHFNPQIAPEEREREGERERERERNRIHMMNQEGAAKEAAR